MEPGLKWEPVCKSDGVITQRLRVSGGWLYMCFDMHAASRTMAFVPVPHEPVPRREPEQTHGSQAV